MHVIILPLGFAVEDNVFRKRADGRPALGCHEPLVAGRPHRPCRSGVAAVGMGSKLFPREMVKAGDWASISERCAKSLAWFQK